MKYTLAILFATLALGGCATVVGQIPSVKNCQHVTYVRDYSVIKIQAECDVSQPGF